MGINLKTIGGTLRAVGLGGKLRGGGAAAILAGVLLAAPALAPVAMARAEGDGSGVGPFVTENVVFVLINGIRNAEAFDLDPGGGPHPFLPHINDELRPQGTVLLNNWNLHYTKSLAPINALLTGAPHVSSNRGEVGDPRGWRDMRSLYPNILEHGVKDLGLDPSRVLYLSNKYNMDAGEYGRHPLYGPSVGPGTILFVDPKKHPFETGGVFLSDDNPDDLLRDELFTLMEYSEKKAPEDYPALAFFGLGVVDNAGHGGPFDLYGDAIRNADDVVDELWTFLQSHPHYAGKTTMIVTTPHGRRLEANGGFRNHTGGDRGSRGCFALFLGPDTPAGVEVTRFTTIEDFAPTVATLLGFDMPWALGDVIHEVIGVDRADARRDTESEPVLATAGDELFLAYRKSTDQVVDLEFRRGTVAGPDITWESPIGLTGASAEDLAAENPTIGFGGDGSLQVAWAQREDAEGLWHSRFTASTDGGDTFLSPRTVATEILSDIDGKGYFLPLHPELVEGGTLDQVLQPIYVGGEDVDLISLFRSGNGFLTELPPVPVFESGIRGAFARSLASDWVESEGKLRFAFVRDDLDAGLVDRVQRSETFFTTVDPSAESPLLRSRRSPRVASGPRLNVRITTSSVPSVHATMARDGADKSRLFVAWSEQTSAAGPWQVFLRMTTDGGKTWSPRRQLTSSTLGAWEPSIAVDEAGVLHVVYVDFDGPLGDVGYVTLATDGTLGTPTIAQTAPTPAVRPQIALTENEGGVVVWIEETVVAAAKLF